MIEFQLPDMTCSHCASLVAQVLKRTDPACLFNFDIGARTVQVQSSEDRQTLVEALAEAGYPPA
jgi:copper chaperone